MLDAWYSCNIEKVREHSQLFSFVLWVFGQKHFVMEVSTTSCKDLNSVQTTLTQMCKFILQTIAICGSGWVLETTSFQTTSRVQSKFDLYLQWSCGQIPEQYCASGRQVWEALQIFYGYPWPQEMERAVS